jgi:hypothetical protein
MITINISQSVKILPYSPSKTRFTDHVSFYRRFLGAYGGEICGFTRENGRNSGIEINFHLPAIFEEERKFLA